MMRKISFLLAAVLLLGLLAACGSGSSVRDDVSVAELSDKVMENVAVADNMMSADASYISGMMQMDVTDYAEYIVNINAYGTSVDEFGIFKGNDKTQTNAIADAVKTYLQLRIDTWIPEYMPEEFPKLENAEYKVVGNYVMYAVLSDAEREAAFSAFESALQG